MQDDSPSFVFEMELLGYISYILQKKFKNTFFQSNQIDNHDVFCEAQCAHFVAV